MSTKRQADTIAAFIGEPVMGVGGMIPPPEGYWDGVQDVLRRHGILLIVDEIVTVSDVAAQKMAQRLAREEGLLVGPSSGANVAAACELASRYSDGIVITVLCDTGERYLF